MTTYRRETAKTFTKEEEHRFRELMNTMAKSVKGYTNRKIGDALKIVSVYDTPFYKLVLKTQNDTRTIRSGHERYNGQMIPQRTVFSESDFNKWDICEAPKPYRNASMSFYVSGSKHIEKCPTCNATGVVACGNCGGKGSVRCSKCGGSGTEHHEELVREICPSCHGTGGTKTVEQGTGRELSRNCCYRCGGNGYINVKQQIPSTCSSCGGSGRKTCGTCNGSGRLTCSTCGGNGKVVYYLAVDQNASVKHDTKFIMTGDLPSDEKVKYVESFDRTDGTLIFQHGNDGISFDRKLIGSQDFMTGTLQKMAEDLANTASNKIIYNEFQIYEYSALTVTYRVDSKDYTCILQGDSWDVFTVTSPISDFMDDLKSKVISLTKMRRYGSAWTVMKRILNFPQAGDNERKVKEDLEDAMKRSTKLGVRFAFLAFVLAMLPLLAHYFKNYELLSPWAHWIVDKLSVRTGLGIIFYLIFNAICLSQIELPKFTYLREKMPVRFLLGFCHGIVCQAFIVLGFIFLDWIGVIPILDLMLFVAIYAIILLIIMLVHVCKWLIGLIF
ncbi:MAG: hypothetical protein MJZ90_00425 [Bacteroidales bacterium]|nr:hypothetical protein [Bacteroidales bacterium]